MDKILLLSRILMLCQIITAVFSFIILAKIAKTKVKDRSQSQVLESTKELPTVISQAQFNSLQDELEKTKAGYATLQNEFRELEKKKRDLDKELFKQKEVYNLSSAELNQIRKENIELKNKLVNKERKEQELEKIVAQGLVLETELKKKNEAFQVLEKENKEMVVKLKDLEAQIQALKQPPPPPVSKEEVVETKKDLRVIRDQKKGKIGEILLANNFITRDILDKALKYKEEFGGNITQYLLTYGFINERQLAQCLCTQFAIPYLPVSDYKIPDEIIKLVPVDMAEKYWLVPVERIGNLLTVVMADLLDTKAIKVIEEITGCRVHPFVGILSEIIEALENYYKVIITEKGLRDKATAPFFIDTQTYKGPERREAIRFKAKIDVYFPVEGYYKKSKTRDVSRTGFLFESESALTIGSFIPLQIDLPREFTPLPITAVVQVIRVTPLENNNFGIGVKIIKISREEIDTILKYASTHEVE